MVFRIYSDVKIVKAISTLLLRLTTFDLTTLDMTTYDIMTLRPYDFRPKNIFPVPSEKCWHVR